MKEVVVDRQHQVLGYVDLDLKIIIWHQVQHLVPAAVVEDLAAELLLLIKSKY